MAKYEVHYAFEVTEGNEDSEGNKFARGFMEVETDVPVESREEMQELTKQVYQEIDGGKRIIKQLVVDNLFILDDEGKKIELAD